MRIGIDVGGTNTDAALLDERTVVAEVKARTTRDVTSGILAALRALVPPERIDPAAIRAVMIGTTHFTNAVVEGKHLTPTACIRLGLPATRALPPMVAWPSRLKHALGNHTFLVHGGHEFDGREIAPLDPAELRRVAEQIGQQGIQSIAIASVFSPVNAELEQRAAEILAAELPGTAISVSHEIGRIGLLERENATIMNACLHGIAVQIVGSFQRALEQLSIAAPVFISQNDGTLMKADYALRYPVATFASGPTNSMRGAAFLSGVADCAVVDIGGTTSDVGMLENGFPRQAMMDVEVGGVRTNFRMPDVVSLGLGGGSLVRYENRQLTVGPDSVGYELTKRALVFGGSETTATDVAVAADLAKVGNPELVASLDPHLIEQARRAIETPIAEAVDRMKTRAGDIPVVVVGGGSILVDDRFPGASQIIKPPHFAVANAIGAAIAQIGGETDRVFSLEHLSREAALDHAQDEAIEKAVAAGASRNSVEVVDIDEIPLAYLPSNACRIHVRAVGELELASPRTLS
jgi:N-methylhydantoinase A/oxoprolinase/acetone carboxylase beta subunit